MGVIEDECKGGLVWSGHFLGLVWNFVEVCMLPVLVNIQEGQCVALFAQSDDLL